jgi:hypothetical protein
MNPRMVLGQFVADNSSRTIRRMDNSLRTIHRMDNSLRTIRRRTIRRNGIIQPYHYDELSCNELSGHPRTVLGFLVSLRPTYGQNITSKVELHLGVFSREWCAHAKKLFFDT